MNCDRSLLFFLSLFVFIALPDLSKAQEDGKRGAAFECGTDILLRKQMEEDPRFAEKVKAEEEKFEEAREDFVDRAGQVYVIPVVFHIIHDNGPENISDDLIKDEVMEQLNLDFRKNNSDTSDIVSPFDDLADDAEIEFRLAQKDPNGNCHKGITRTRSELTEHEMWPDDGMKDLISWDRSSYLNVWIVRSINGNVAGYATKPGQAWPTSHDGIVVEYSFLGSGERTLTHEIGHYLNLDHTWGQSNQPGDQSNCNEDDGLSDTPNTIGWQGCSDPADSSCNSQDNIQNYMEYSYCHLMFTPDQVGAMRTALNSSAGEREQLWKSSNLQATGTDGTDILCKAIPEAEQRMVCEGEPVQFNDRSFHGPTSWSWDFDGGTPDDPNAEDPVVTYNDTGMYDVTLTVSNSSGSKDTTLKDYIKVIPKPGWPLPFIETFDWPRVPLNDHLKYHITDPGNDGREWHWTDEAGEGGSNGSIMLENYENEGGEIDHFETTSIDASTLSSSDLKLSFDLAYAKQNSGDGDELIIYASNDCGENWDQRGSFTSNTMETVSPTTDRFVPEDHEWEQLEVSTSLVSIYNVEDLRFRFEFINDGGNNVFIDNINVYDENNVGIEENEKMDPSLSVHPNPVEENAVLELELPRSENVNVEVRDLLGKKVKGEEWGEREQGTHRMELDMGELEAGPYFVTLRIGEERLTQKVFKR